MYVLLDKRWNVSKENQSKIMFEKEKDDLKRETGGEGERETIWKRERISLE